MGALCIDPLPYGRENAADPMPTLHRRALLTAAAAILTAPRPSAALKADPGRADLGAADLGRADPTLRARSAMLIVNALGGLEDPNRPESNAEASLLEPRVLRDAHDSGLTAVNVTLGYVSGDADPFEQSVRDVAQMDARLRAGAKDLLKVYTADDI